MIAVAGKTISRIYSLYARGIVIHFTDGTRMALMADGRISAKVEELVLADG